MALFFIFSLVWAIFLEFLSILALFFGCSDVLALFSKILGTLALFFFGFFDILALFIGFLRILTIKKPFQFFFHPEWSQCLLIFLHFFSNILVVLVRNYITRSTTWHGRFFHFLHPFLHCYALEK